GLPEASRTRRAGKGAQLREGDVLGETQSFQSPHKRPPMSCDKPPIGCFRLLITFRFNALAIRWGLNSEKRAVVSKRRPDARKEQDEEDESWGIALSFCDEPQASDARQLPGGTRSAGAAGLRPAGWPGRTAGRVRAAGRCAVGVRGHRG